MAEQNGEEEKPGPTIGEVMPDGTVYAGVSPETGQAMFTTAADVPATCSFDHAQDYAAKLDVHGYRDWRVPTPVKVSLVAAAPEGAISEEAVPRSRDGAAPAASWVEFNVLFQNRVAIGGLYESGSGPAGWYWSSSQYDYNTAWGQRFCDGKQFYLNLKDTDSSVRCVR